MSERKIIKVVVGARYDGCVIVHPLYPQEAVRSWGVLVPSSALRDAPNDEQLRRERDGWESDTWRAREERDALRDRVAELERELERASVERAEESRDADRFQIERDEARRALEAEEDSGHKCRCIADKLRGKLCEAEDRAERMEAERDELRDRLRVTEEQNAALTDADVELSLLRDTPDHPTVDDVREAAERAGFAVPPNVLEFVAAGIDFDAKEVVLGKDASAYATRRLLLALRAQPPAEPDQAEEPERCTLACPHGCDCNEPNTHFREGDIACGLDVFRLISHVRNTAGPGEVWQSDLRRDSIFVHPERTDILARLHDGVLVPTDEGLRDLARRARYRFQASPDFQGWSLTSDIHRAFLFADHDDADRIALATALDALAGGTWWAQYRGSA